MNRIYIICVYFVFALCVFPAHARTGASDEMLTAREYQANDPLECFNPATVLQGDRDGKVRLPGGSYTSYSTKGVPSEIIVPNAKGDDFVRIPIENTLNPSATYLDAHELRLKVRELTSQLLETWAFSGVKGMVAYITTFTPQHDLTLPTPFGQYLRDAFTYEFNNRGFPVRDYSARDLIINEGGFAFGISDGTYKVPVVSKDAAIITGTFYRDEDYLFMNVRLIRGYDGMVLRTAQTIFPVTPLVGRMTERSYRPKAVIPPPLSVGGLPIVQGKPLQ